MANKLNALHKRVMRRVYYAYVVKLAFNPFVMHGFLLGLSIVALTHAVSVPSILTNMSNIKVGYLDDFILNALMRTDVLTLTLIGLICFTMLSLRFNMRSVRFRHTQMV